MERIAASGEIQFELDMDTLIDVFSDMHLEQGVRIMNHWEIPELYSSIIAQHHAESFDPSDTLLAIVRLVNFNSMKYGLNLYPRLVQPRNVEPETEALAVDSTIIERLAEEMQAASA